MCALEKVLSNRKANLTSLCHLCLSRGRCISYSPAIRRVMLISWLLMCWCSCSVKLVSSAAANRRNRTPSVIDSVREKWVFVKPKTKMALPRDEVTPMLDSLSLFTPGRAQKTFQNLGDGSSLFLAFRDNRQGEGRESFLSVQGQSRYVPAYLDSCRTA